MPYTDQQVYKLIHTDLRPKLGAIMRSYGLDEANQEDALSDFCLFLRDGNRPELPHRPYSKLESIKDLDKLGAWVGITFRNWLLARNVRQERNSEAEKKTEALAEEDDSEHIYSEADTARVIELMELVNERLSARERYIFFTGLLALQTGNKATKEMAKVLGMTENNVRVLRKRTFEKIQKLFKQ